jgi:hypothetical protein
MLQEAADEFLGSKPASFEFAAVGSAVTKGYLAAANLMMRLLVMATSVSEY